jgi:nucleoid DNA-binding protein
LPRSHANRLETPAQTGATRVARAALDGTKTTPTAEKPRKSSIPAMAKKTAAPKLKKISPSAKPRTKGQFYGTISEATGMKRREVATVFDAMGKVLSADLGKGGSGVCNVAGLMKVLVVRKPATKARKGINPFTKQEVIFKAKPARNVVKIRALKTLKKMV